MSVGRGVCAGGVDCVCVYARESVCVCSVTRLWTPVLVEQRKLTDQSPFAFV